QAAPAVSTTHCQPLVSHPLMSSTFSAQVVSVSHSQPSPRTLIVQFHASDNQSRRFRMVPVTAGACSSSQSQASPAFSSVQLHASPSQPASVSIVVATHGKCSSIHAQASPRRLIVQSHADFNQSRTSSTFSVHVVLTSQFHA